MTEDKHWENLDVRVTIPSDLDDALSRYEQDPYFNYIVRQVSKMVGVSVDSLLNREHGAVLRLHAPSAGMFGRVNQHADFIS